MKELKDNIWFKVTTPLKIQKWDIGKRGNSTMRRSLTLKAKASIAVAVILLVVTATVISICFFVRTWPERYWMPSYESGSMLGRYQNAAVSTDAAPCAPIGKDILHRNGSAIDAVIAVLVCMGVVNPQSLGLGGGFLMVYYDRDTEKVYYLDARETAPSAASENMFDGNATVAKYGGKAIAVPGELAGYYFMHKKFGRLPWAELFVPSVKMCREGITVNAHLERALKKQEKDLRKYEHIRKMFVKNDTNELLREGDVYKREDLAKTMEAIMKHNVKALYGGTELASKFLQDLKDAGSIITADDMLNYEPNVRDPISVGLRGNLTLFGTSPPGSGALLALILHVMDGYQDLSPEVTKSMEGTVRMLHRIVETFKFTYAQRAYMEDDDGNNVFIKELVKKVISREYADEIRSKINDNQTFDDPQHYGLHTPMTEDHGTAHVSIIAPNGDAVSVTSTINTYFGSMVVSPSTGIILNNEMDDFSSPNITNYFGVPPVEGRNRIRPGRRPFSSMTPAIVVDDKGDVRLNLGGNGGTQITTSVAQVMLRTLMLGENIKKAIDAPRFHHQLLPDQLEHEPNYPEDILRELKLKGHKLKVLGEKMLGIIMGVERGHDGFLYANSDYRKGGEVDGF